MLRLLFKVMIGYGYRLIDLVDFSLGVLFLVLWILFWGESCLGFGCGCCLVHSVVHLLSLLSGGEVFC